MYQFLISSIIREVEFNFKNADNKDVERSAFTAGNVAAYVSVLNNIGHSVKHGDWDDNGCSRVGYLEIDGKVLIKNSIIDYQIVANEFKELGVIE